MDIKSLKQAIEEKTLSNDLLIFKYSDSKFLCDQYVDEIAKIKNLKKLNIDSLEELESNDSFFDNTVDPYLYIYTTDELFEIDSTLNNVIVLCKKVNKNISTDYIEFPNVQKWQIEEFLKMRMPGLKEDQILWLCEICNYNFYRLDNECKKIEIFNPQTQSIIFNQMNIDNSFSDLNTLTIFNLSNAIMQKDFNTILSIISNLKNIDIEATGLVTILLRQFKTSIEVFCNNKWNDSLSCSEKQFKYLKYNSSKYTWNQLINIYEFLLNIDYRLKNGELTLKEKSDHLTVNNILVDYLITNILTCA